MNSVADSSGVAKRKFVRAKKPAGGGFLFLVEQEIKEDGSRIGCAVRDDISAELKSLDPGSTLRVVRDDV